MAYTAIADNPATSPPAAAALQWLMKPFRLTIDYVRRLWGETRRNKERKEAEAKLLAADPEGSEYIDNEMDIRMRPI